MLVHVLATNQADSWTTVLNSWLFGFLPNLITAAALLALGWWGSKKAGELTKTLLDRQTAIDLTLRNVVVRIVRYAILVIVLITALGQLGIQTTSLLAALGAIGLAIGLALQGTLSNIAAGIMLLWLRPFKIGDYIKASTIEGTVTEVGLFATKLTTLEGLYLFAPNNELWNTQILNYSKMPIRMIRDVFTISYDDDIGAARRVLLELCEADTRIHAAPEPSIQVTELGDSAVGLELRAWTDTTVFAKTRWELIENVKNSLDEAGISIPFPQQDIHLYAAQTDDPRPNDWPIIANSNSPRDQTS